MISTLIDNISDCTSLIDPLKCRVINKPNSSSFKANVVLRVEIVKTRKPGGFGPRLLLAELLLTFGCSASVQSRSTGARKRVKQRGWGGRRAGKVLRSDAVNTPAHVKAAMVKKKERTANEAAINLNPSAVGLFYAVTRAKKPDAS